jgi:prefoldin beta subunit
MATKEILQSLANQLQTVAQQVQTVESQVKEIQGTLEALSSQEDGRSIFRQVGPLLLEVEDRDALQSDLEKSKDTLSAHLKRLKLRESELRDTYEEQVKAFESA